MKDENLIVSVSGVCRLLKKLKENGSIACRQGSGCPTTPAVLKFVEEQMILDDETSAVQLQKILADKGHQLCLQTILNSREKLG